MEYYFLYYKDFAIILAIEIQLTSDFNVSVPAIDLAPAAYIFKTASLTRMG